MKRPKTVLSVIACVLLLLFGYVSLFGNYDLGKAIVAQLINQGRLALEMTKNPEEVPGMRTQALENFGTSTAYFRAMVDGGRFDVSFNFFVAPHMRPARDSSEFCASNNVWCIVAGALSAPSNIPAYFTSSLNITSLNQRVFTLGSITKRTPRGVIVIMRDGDAMFLRTEKEVRDLLDKCHADNRVLRP